MVYRIHKQARLIEQQLVGARLGARTAWLGLARQLVCFSWSMPAWRYIMVAADNCALRRSTGKSPTS